MSLHAQLSPEAQKRLQSQRRTSSVMSLVISLLAITLVVLVLAFLILKFPAMENPHVVFHYGKKPTEDPPVPKQVSISQKPNPAPAGAPNRVLVTLTQSELAMPIPDVIPTDLGPVGDGDGLDFGIGDQDGPPGGPGPIPDIRTSKRCSEADRLQRLKETGGPVEVEEAVVKTLRWLKANQNQDGSWGTANKVGMTGLALLAYLGHCETPVSEEFGPSCTSAIVYLLDVAVKNKGKMAANFQDKHWPYEHAIATYALAEALSMGPLFGYNIPQHREAVRDAGQWIIDNQHQSGGWDYSYEEASGRGGDLSVTGWQLQALRACKSTGIEYRNLTACVRRSLDYVEARQDSSGGFGYTGTTPVGGLTVHSLTGVGTLSFQIWEKASHSAARKGVKYLQKNAVLDYDGPASDLYAHYYHSQAMMQNGGNAWTKYNQTFAPQLLKAQQPDGSFKPPGGGNKVEAVGALFEQNTPEGLVYRNCLCALMLEVYYRYLPGTS